MRKLFIALSIAFLFISCDTENMDNQQITENQNPFIGTWETESNDPDCPSKMVFTADEVTCYDKDNNVFSCHMTGDAVWKGTYTYKPIYTNDPYKTGYLQIHYTPYSFFETPCRFEGNVLILHIDIRYNKANS